MPASRDTLSVIQDLSRVVRNDPEAVEIYLALGNLFRAQGDIERAVMIREGLMARPGLNPRFKARASFELGQDYHRSGVVDRALTAYAEALSLGYDANAVTAERGDLHAGAGDYAKAAEEYRKLGHARAQAHYLVRAAEDMAVSGNDSQASGLVKKALRVFSGSPEAWSALISMTALAEEWRKIPSLLGKSLTQIHPSLRFLVLESLLNAGSKVRGTQENSSDSFAASLCDAVLPVLEKQEQDLLLAYYGALFLRNKGDAEEANVWLAKALVVEPDFWAARLELLVLFAASHLLPPVVELQLDYFTGQLRHVKRFFCTVCGLRQESVFYRCPRCASWHSISFRPTLQE